MHLDGGRGPISVVREARRHADRDRGGPGREEGEFCVLAWGRFIPLSLNHVIGWARELLVRERATSDQALRDTALRLVPLRDCAREAAPHGVASNVLGWVLAVGLHYVEGDNP